MAGVMYASATGGVSTSGEPAFGVAAQAFSVNYLKALYDKLGAWKHIRNFTADVSAFGEAVNIPNFPRLTAVDVLASTGVFTYENTGITRDQIVINKSKAVAYSVPETVLLQSKLDIRAAFADEAARAVSDCLDHEMAKLIPSLTTNSVGTLNADLSEAICLEAIGRLVRNHWDVSNPDDMVWILPSTQFGIVHALKGYAQSYRIINTNTNDSGGNDIRAALDTLYGIPVHWRSDTELLVSADAAYGGLFARDSVGIAIQRMPTMRQPMPIPGTINTELLTYALFGIATLKQEVACLLKCQ